MQRLRLQVANEHHYLNEKYIINGDWICAFLIDYDNVFFDLELSVFGSIFLENTLWKYDVYHDAYCISKKTSVEYKPSLQYVMMRTTVE